MSVRDIEQKGGYNYTYSDAHEPIARIQPGETVRIHCVDCFENRLVDESMSYADVCEYPYLNPQTGPVFIEGVEPGDTLLVHIEDIEITRDWAVTGLVPRFGLLTGTTTTATLNAPLPEIVRKLPIRNGRVCYGDRSFPIQPFMGTIGTAPRLEAINALTPSYYGGNMDCVETRPGNEVWFPVLVPDAHFFTGDAHANQGDGELTGVALEIPAKVTVTFDLKKDYTVQWPRIISKEFIMVAGSARPLDAAARIAWVELIDWLVNDFGFDRLKAYHLLGQVGQMRLGNMVDPKFTMVAKMPRKYLG